MRRFLLTTIAFMMTICMMAVGTGNGSNQVNAIDFSWSNGHDHAAGATLWYQVDLDSISGLVDPTLALYLTNMSDQPAVVSVDVNAKVSYSLPIPGFKPVEKDTMIRANYTIDGKGYELWSQNVKELIKLNVTHLDLKLSSSQNIKLSAKKYETSEIIDIACEDADDFDWNGVQVEAGEKWYRLNLAEVKARNQKLNFVVANQGTQNATVAFDLSLDCPASVVFAYNWTIPAGGSMTEEFGRVFIDELKEDYVYLKLNTNQALNLRVEELPAPAPKDETWAIDATLQEGKAYTFSGEHIFKVSMATLSAPRGMKAEFVITNNSNEDATLTKQISFANPVKSTIDKELIVAAGATVTKEVVNNMAGVITSETAYIRFNATQELTVQLNYVVVNEEVMNAKPVEVASCQKSELLNWRSTVKQSGLETKWYEIDLSSFKKNGEHLQLTFTNKSNNIVVVMGEILRACEGDTLPYICPVPAGMSVSQVINYNMFALLQYPDHFYMSATVIPTTATSIMEFKDVRTREDLMKFVPKDLNAIQDAEVELTANTISALVDPTACNQATTIAKGVKYEQAAGTTQWYRVTDDLLNKLSLIPDVAFINNGKQAANVTLAASVDCEHSTFGMSTFSLPTWADLTVFPIRLLGDLMDKALNQDVTEVYLQVTTDQPIAFGVDIDYGFGLGCDDAREFDWTKGAVIEKGDAQWLSFDISSVKQNKQQVKLTLTNESNSIAWVGMMVSLTCPFDVALPMVFPIPAGASVDKVVDYSYFAATKLDQLYVAIITEETISLKAVAEEATASPMDKLACENAIEVESGETYENKGTQWYKFSGQLFSDMSRLPRFMFATPEGKTKVTVGATVGCEYNIATRVTLPLPGNLDLSFRFPSRIFDLIRKFVHQDVTEVYLEMTTDKKLVWSIDMTYVDACETAIELDFSKPIKLDLKANEDVWYKVDVNSIKGLKNKNLELALYNNNDKAVDIEVEVSPTCPVVVSASKTKSIAAYDSLVYAVPTSQVLAIHDRLLEAYPILKGLSENLVYYVRVRANGDLTVNTDTVTPPPTPEGCENAQLLDWTKTINLSELHTGWYKFDISSIHANKKDFTLSLNNDMGEKKNLGFTFYQDCDTYLFGPLVLSFPVGITEQTIPYSMMTLLGGMDMLYVYLELDAKLPCEDAILFDWNKGAYQEANKTQWYEFDITPVLEQEKQVKLTFTNHSNENAWVVAELALSCPYAVSIPIIVPVPANMSVDKWIDYSVFEASKLKHCYLGVTTREAAIELAATWEDARVAPSDGCLNATLVQTDSLYEHAAGTHWYKFTGDLFDGEGKFSRVHLINRSAKTVNITAGATVGCEYNIATRTKMKLPMRFDLAFAIPVWVVEQMKRFVDNDVKEFYLELTTDQPIAFSFGMDACEEAIPFDWANGHTQEALTTQWYEVDITSVIENKQQVKLTFTNHSNTIAWVASLVSLDCPFKVAMPVMLPIPAGMSVDHVIDYSYFAATRLQHLYVGVTTEEKISIIAEAQDATASSTDQAACANAIEVKSGEVYENRGTQWYKFSGAFFEDASRFPQFMFAAPNGQANVTLGATVGCEYNIANRGTFTLPNTNGLSLAFRFPSFIFDVIKKFVNPAVTEFYLEMTSDKQVDWSLNMDYVGTCASAVDLDLSRPIHLDLKANEDVWYKVDLNAIKALGNKEIEYAIVNGTNDAVEIVAEVSPSCPVVLSAAATHSIAANDSLVGTVPAKLITTAYDNLLTKYSDYDVLLGDLIYYVRVRATGDLTVDADTITPETPDFVESCKDAELLDWTKTINLSDLETGWYKLNISSLRANKQDFTLSLNNNTGDVKKLRFFFYEDCSDIESELENLFLTSLSVTAPKGLTTEKVPYAALNYLLGDDVDEFYVYLEIEGGELNEACLNAMLLDDPNVPHTIQLVAGKEQWFKVATNALEKLQYNLKVSVDAEVSDVTVSVSSSCLVEPIIDTTVVLGNARHEEVELSKSTILDKWSKYSSKVSDIDTAYVRVLSTGNITLNTDTVTPTPPADPDDCENATLLDWTQTVNLSTLTTGWYKFDISSLHASQSDFSLSLNNDMGETKAVEMTLYLSCDQPYEAKTTQVFPVGITTRQVAYSLLTQVVGTADMIYVYIKTDVEVPVIPEADACLNAIELTWNDTLNINAGDTTWYMLPLAEAKALGKDLELTVSNNSGSVANVYVAVSEQCPVVAFLTERRGSVDPGSITKLLKHNELNSLADTVYFLLSSTEELSIGVSVYNPVPPTEPDSCLNGTLLDWTQTVNLSTLTTGWYKFDISSLHASQSDFTLSLNNDMGETKAVEMTLYLSCDQPYEAKTTQVFPVGITTRQVAYSLLTQVVGTADMIYVYIKTDVEVPVIPEADACLNAIELTWNDTLNINAGDTTWYMLPLAEAKALGKDLTLTVINSNDADANVYVAVAETCPVLAYLTERTGTVPANMTISRTLSNSELTSLADTVYFRLSSTQDLTISVAVAVEEPEQPQGCEDATLLDWTKTINLSDLKTGWYKFDISSVHTANKDFTLSLNNDLGEAKNLGFRLYKDCDSPMMGETVMTFPVGITSRTIPASLLSLVDGIDMLYVYLTIDAPLPCEGAILFDWNKGAYQEANKTQWYEFDITPVLDQEKQVKLTFTNHSNENAWVIAELAFHCPYTKSIPIIVPVPAGMSVDKWIDYSAFEASRIEHFYMGVTTREAAIELAATWEDARIAPSEGCLNATLVENEVLYEHAAGTHWYKFTGDLFEGEGSFSRVHVINRSAKTVNITAGGTVGCEYNIATRTNFKLPRRFDLAFAIPVWVVEQMKKFIDDDVTEFYLELTTDQPIAFSFGMDACEEAIPFDWTTGHTQEALTTQWYNVDIAPVLANEQQIKLTFTNHSDQTAWVATLVSLNCPFKVALPLAFPIPAGMSVDKVIDYSYFAATRLDQIYVGVTTDSKISVIAEAQSAIAHPNDKAACASAKTLKVDENNIHPSGTAWYRVDGSLFADMERLPKFRFETVSGETTTVTIGATVGCDYNIATRGTVKMPGGLDMYLRAPRFIFSVIEKFIDDDVNEFYVELTTDKDVEFTIFADHDEDLTACSSATDFVLSDSMTISLEADKDVWYKVDMKALKANDQDWSISVVNPSDKAVDVEVEVSPTCPMVASAMKEFTVPASINVATVITSEQIATYIAKFPNLVYYVRIRATENLTIEVTEPEVVDDVEACYEAIDYVYGTDIVLNGESDVWYKLNIKELRDKNENIMISVTNNSNDTAKATLDIYDSCPVEYPIVSMKNLVVEPLQVIRREVSASYLPEDVDSIYLHVRATGSLTVNVSTKEEPQPEHVFAYDTITQYYCPVDLPEITTWNDTVKVTELLDSVYTYNAESLIAPIALTQQEIANILGADFGLIAGTTPDMDASLALIKAFYVTNDSEQVADVVNVAWVTKAIPCGTTTHTMTLNVTDECSNIVSTEYVFDVVAQNVTTIEETITICSHELPYEWNDMQFATAGTHTTSIPNVYGCDSAKYILHLNVLPAIPATDVYATVCSGETFIWDVNNESYTESGKYSVTMASSDGCDSIVTLNLTVLPPAKRVVTDTTICNARYVWPINGKPYRTDAIDSVMLESVYGCDSVLHVLKLRVLPPTKTVKIDTVICASQLPFRWKDQVVWGNDHTVVEEYQFTTYDKFLGFECDSVEYLMNLYILPEAKEENKEVLLCVGDSYTWDVNGQSYTHDTAGTYQHTHVIKNSLGCDSIIHNLNLVVSDGFTLEARTICYGKTWDIEVDGITYSYNTSGTYLIESNSGCKATFVLKVLDAIPTTYVDSTVCFGETVTWEHETLNQTGSTTKTLKSVFGCDSVVIFNLTVLPQVADVEIYDTICAGEKYNWKETGKTYSTSTTDYVIKQDANGCDYKEILNLTVRPANNIVVEPVTKCYGETYTWYGDTYNASGQYFKTLQDINGCDSVAAIDLIILPQVLVMEENQLICEGDSIEWQGETIKEAGVYTKTLKNINGCDSVVNLNLAFLANGADTVINASICQGTSYDWYGEALTLAGTYTHYLSSCNATATLHLTINDPKYTSETVVACDSIEWNGTVYTASGTYFYRHTTTDGCEQVDTLHLTINKSEYETYTATACDEYTWNGITYTQSGVYTFETTTSAGCKRVETLNLTINNSVTSEESVIACDSYPWNGTTYTQSGDYVAKLQTVNGCDSTVTLHLTINKSETVESTETACDSYEWHGVTYTQSGDYTYTTTVNGCDKVEILHLTINKPEYASYHATACGEYTWQLNGQTYDKSGVYTYERTTAAGCVKVDTLHLTINESYNLELTASACGSYEWNNQVYTASGDYVAQLQTVNGCDSIVTLHLTINPVQPDVLTETACGSYTWHGQVYTQSGTYTYSSTAVNGCEQVDTLHLTVYETEYKQEEKQYMCVGDSYTWDVNNETYYQGGIYRYAIKYSSYDCDSVVYTLNLSELAYGQDSIEYQTVCEPITWQGQYLSQSGIYRDTLANCNATLTLYLTVNHPVSSVITEEACKSYEWNGQVYTTSGDYTQTFTAANGCDSVVTLHLTIKQPVEVTKDVTACGSYTIDGKTYTQSGMYVQRLTAANGCDSIINWNLTINDTYKVELNETACDSYEWADSTYTTSGTYEKTFTAANGCDSVVTLHLTINKSESVSFTETACGSYEWSVTGVTYTESGVYADTTIVNGCDHIKTLYLTINKPSTADVFATACGSYTWNGTTYTTSGNYDFTTVAANGCDSVVTLHLTIHNPVTVEVSEVACGSYEWHGTTYTTSGNYRYTTTGVNGCDSTTILHLTINQPVSVEYNATACDSYEWRGNVYTTSGDYTYTTKAANGCDSVEILHLTVNKSVRVDVYDKSCGAITWNGIDCDKTGDYTYTTTSTTGCDSTTILHLTVYETTEKTIIHSMCEGSSYVWPINGKTYTQAGSDTYAIPFAGMNTCDSIVYTLNVVVLQDGESKHDTVSICEGLSYEFNGRYLTESGVYTMTLDSCNAVYTLTLNVIKPVMSDTIAESCGSFNWYGQEFTTSGDYTKTFKAITTGCDSIVTLHLTINQAETQEYSEVACESYDWRGTTYYTSGTYYNTVQGGATNGCDLKEVLHLTVHPKTDDVVENVTICSGDSYVWNNNTYTTSTTETVTLQDANGCDYQATLNLTVLPATQYEPVETATICYGDNYLWHGTTYTTQGTHQYVLKNVANCDSIVYTLDLKVRPRVSPTTTTKAICDGDNFVCPISGISYNTSGYHSHTLQDVNGCDSLVTVHLIVMEKVDTVLYDTICHGDTYTFHGKVYTTSGVYENTLPSVLTPCDSVVTLHLHVLPEIPAIIDKETIDEGQVYIWPVNNQPYSVAGTYKETLTAANGCDSVRILELTVIPAPVYQVERDTISEYICDGTGYVDPITEKQHIISSLIPSTQTWNDTVNVTATLDSIYTFIITPIVAPEVMTDAVLEAIGATPTLTQGALPNVTGTVDAITAYYNGNDSESIADVNNVYWSNANTAVECGADTHTMTLVVEAGCDNVITTTHVFNVQPIAAGPMFSMTICAGDSYLWPVNGKSYAQGGIYLDTIKTINGCDSIVTLELTVLPEAIVAPSNDVIIFAGKTYTWPVNNMTYSKPGIYKDTLKNYLGCDSLINTLNLTVMPVVINAPTTYATICYGDTYVWEFNGKPYDAAGLYSDTIKNSYGSDSIVAILSLNVLPDVIYAPVEEATICFGDTYNWRGQERSESASDTLKNYLGCDSIIYRLNLTINKPAYTEIYETTCDSYDWYTGTLTESGVYVHTLQTTAGCDSIVTLRLTINKSDTVEFTEVACDFYTWHGEKYESTGDYTYRTTNDAGCEQLEILHLTINKSFYNEETVTACDSYTWSVDGNTYTESGDKYFNGKTVAGCDSTYVLHLTINKSFYNEETVSACDSYTWSVDGNTYTESGDKYFNGKTVAGCDSTYVLHLTINKSVLVEESVTACVSYTWNGQTYTISGDYTFQGETAAGCDSVAILHLTILPDVVYEPTETDYFCSGSTYEWFGNVFNAPGTYTHTLHNSLGCDSIIYTLELVQYVNTLPVITADDIVAVCGSAIEVTIADAIINAHIASEALYAPNAEIKWYMLNGDTYVELTNTAIDGSLTEVTLKVVVTTDCGSVESDPIVVQVKTPSPENDDTLDEVPAYNKYGGRLLTVDLKYINETLGLNVAEDEVTWYLVVEGADDIEQGKGYYLTTEDGTPLPAGEYYALISYQGKTGGECDLILQTIILIVETQVGPLLAPTVANPNELLRLLHLDANTTSTISIYSSTGQMLDSFQVKDAKEISFEAAHTAGYYIVEVQTESDKVSLRYVVK